MTVPRRNSELLADLDKVASAVLRMPASAFGKREQLEALRTEVDQAIRRPVATVRTIDDFAMFLVIALLHLVRSTDNARRWTDAAEYFQACVRADYVRAAEAELREMTGADGAER